METKGTIWEFKKNPQLPTITRSVDINITKIFGQQKYKQIVFENGALAVKDSLDTESTTTIIYQDGLWQSGWDSDGKRRFVVFSDISNDDGSSTNKFFTDIANKLTDVSGYVDLKQYHTTTGTTNPFAPATNYNLHFYSIENSDETAMLDHAYKYFTIKARVAVGSDETPHGKIKLEGIGETENVPIYGDFAKGSSVTVEAIPYDGYEFYRFRYSDDAASIVKQNPFTFANVKDSASPGQFIAEFQQVTTD